MVCGWRATKGEARPIGVVVGDGVVDLGRALEGRYPDLESLLEAGALGGAAGRHARA
jgi:hypothetical protein